MDTEKVIGCLVSFSEASNLLEDLKESISLCPDLAVVPPSIVAAGSNPVKIQQAVRMIGCLKPELVFFVLPSRRLELARIFVSSMHKEGFKPHIMGFLEDPTSEATIDLFKLGIADVISPPFKKEDVVARVWRILNSSKDPDEKTLGSLKENLWRRKLVGANAAFLAEVNKIPLIARCDANVLITGETGTGKEIIARSIHYLGRRAPKPFVAVSCGAIPADLFENELFGHERGAFTGAVAAQIGLIQEAEEGSLFLDDIDCVPPAAQTKVLRFLQEKEYRPLGSARSRHSETRIISSTNADLAEAVSQDIFRRDLFYRLNVLQITLPPLRERLEDIPVLARHFLSKYKEEMDREVKDISTGALRLLMSYTWPGNVRELENVIQRAVVFATHPILDVNSIQLPERQARPIPANFKEAKSHAVTQFEKKYIQDLLSTYQGNISKSAKAAQKNRRAFWELIRKHKINPEGYKSAAFK